MRTLFGHPIREETTGSFYREKISLEQFCEDLRRHIDPFEKNLLQIEVFKTERYIEEWFETFGAWNEIEIDNYLFATQGSVQKSAPQKEQSTKLEQ